MSFEFDNNKPIYLQLVDIIKLKIISKELKPGSKLSSVRDMAQEFGVNPNTMQRSLSELERENLLYSQRTSGRFVTDNEDNINQLREEVAKVEILSLYNEGDKHLVNKRSRTLIDYFYGYYYLGIDSFD